MGFQDCEYAEEGPTKTEQLEAQIAFLEARIEELEKPPELSPSFGPNTVFGTRRAASLPALSRGGTPRPAHSPIPYASASPTGSSSSFHGPEDIPRPELDALVLNFLQHSSQFGFFLHLERFTEAVMGRSGSRPSPALLHAVHLFAVHISGNDELVATFEARYLSRALRSAVDSLSSSSSNILHAIQAEVLLSQYFFRTTRILEGKYHLSAAISLVLSSGLHRIRSADASATRGFLGASSSFRAAGGSRAPAEDLEQIAAFWTVLTMNNCWTTADGSPSNIDYTSSAPDARIDSPWPIDVDHGDESDLPEVSIGTVVSFLSSSPDSEASLSALHAKAAILFEQASRLADSYHLNMNAAQLNAFNDSFRRMQALVEGFVQNLPSLDNGAGGVEYTREVFLIHALARVASIQLHNPFVHLENCDCNARGYALDAARAIVADLNAIPVSQFQFIDPIAGTIFMATAQVFIQELRRYRRVQETPNGFWDGDMSERELMDAVETVLATMNLFSPTCRLMESQLETMRQAYQSALGASHH
ncbi:Fungal-trans domain-containing protein [Mycena chlorophos]|uniref:Fungal-trans domain-containing protein n=1 Tax=Mycena chlorophos TaxID=658473 RepID=A0A8H6SIZ0_MYCCL|nr:Fungal-trans domain-containing protein [Mycena chlorophos]